MLLKWIRKGPRRVLNISALCSQSALISPTTTPQLAPFFAVTRGPLAFLQHWRHAPYLQSLVQYTCLTVFNSVLEGHLLEKVYPTPIQLQIATCLCGTLAPCMTYFSFPCMHHHQICYMVCFHLGLLFVVCLFLLEYKHQKAGLFAVLFSGASKDHGISAERIEWIIEMTVDK